MYTWNYISVYFNVTEFDRWDFIYEFLVHACKDFIIIMLSLAFHNYRPKY